MTIPEKENRHKNHHVSFWLNEEKYKASEGGTTRPIIIQNKIARKALEKGNNVIGSAAKTTPNEATKKPCLCSPTNHVGSFRCRLHRKNKCPQKWDSISSNNIGQQEQEEVKDQRIKISSFNISDQPRLSRFGRAACDKMPLAIASSRPGQVN